MSRAAQRRACNGANRAISLAAALGLGPGRLPVVHSHYVQALAPTHPSTVELQQTICRRFVNPAYAHSGEPTCPDCAALLAADEQVAS